MQAARPDRCEPLRDLQVLGGAAEALLRMVVGGLHNQGVAFPPADGIAHPRPHRRRQVLTRVEPHDPRVVHHLNVDQHRVLGLHDLVHVVVEAGRHHRPGRVAKRQQAPLAQRPAFGIVTGRHAAGQGAPAEGGDLDVLAHRNPAVGGGGDVTVPRRARDAHDRVARIRPAGVVVAAGAAAAGAVGGQVQHRGVRVGGLGGQLQHRLVLALDLVGLGLGEDQVLAPARIALQAGHADVGPDAFQAGVAVGGARRLVGGHRPRRAVRRQRDAHRSERQCAREKDRLQHLQASLAPLPCAFRTFGMARVIRTGVLR